MEHIQRVTRYDDHYPRLLYHNQTEEGYIISNSTRIVCLPKRFPATTTPVLSSNFAEWPGDPGGQVAGRIGALVLSGVVGRHGVPGGWAVGCSGAMVSLDGLAIPADGQQGTAEHWYHWTAWRS